MDVEEGKSTNPQKKAQAASVASSWKSVLVLAYESLGVVYGQLCLSPLYVYENSFVLEEETNKDEVLGVLSLIIWTLTLVPLFKYVFIVLRADDNGEGGTFALYSLLCRHSNVGLVPNRQLAEEEVEEKLTSADDKKKDVSKAISMLENCKALHYVLFIVALFGSSMVIGDGSLVPAITVFSAAKGFVDDYEDKIPKWVVVVACVLLICLFLLQHFGTHRLGFVFAPIITGWLLCITLLGVYNMYTYRGEVHKALDPYYLFEYISNKSKRSIHWKSLGGILLCIIGSEAMFANLGHFSQSSIKIVFTFMVYPALILGYMGQAAYHLHLLKTKNQNAKFDFFQCTPEHVRKSVAAIAMVASMVGNQAVITGTFSIIHHSLALGCFPRVKVVHTSNTIHGQVYIPEINWILMILSLAITVGLQDSKYMGSACGLAVISVMLVTTFLMSLVIVICWRKSILAALCFLIFFGCIEVLYFSSALYKIKQGAWVSLILSFIFVTIMYVWHYVEVKKYEVEMQNKVSLEWLLKVVENLGLVRVPGIGLIYTQVTTGIPEIFSHLVTTIPAFHQVLVFVSINSLCVSRVPPEQRYLVGRVGPKEYRIYRCIVRYGYRDKHLDHDNFESQLIYKINEFISLEASDSSIEGRMNFFGTLTQSGNGNAIADETEASLGIQDFSAQGKQTSVQNMAQCENPIDIDPPDEGQRSLQCCSNSQTSSDSLNVVQRKKVTFMVPNSPTREQDDIRAKELQDLWEAKESGTVFILGHSHVRARSGSSFLKRLALNVVYKFLKTNSRGPAVALNVPHTALMEVGMVYSL